jgi:hypothetical protein
MSIVCVRLMLRRRMKIEGAVDRRNVSQKGSTLDWTINGSHVSKTMSSFTSTGRFASERGRLRVKFQYSIFAVFGLSRMRVDFVVVVVVVVMVVVIVIER